MGMSEFRGWESDELKDVVPREIVSPEGGDGCVDGVIGEGSWEVHDWQSEEIDMRNDGMESRAAGIVTVTLEDVRNTEGMSWWCHISHRDFTA
jgi:hypothetical protein